jgi:hypothetical protein
MNNLLVVSLVDPLQSLGPISRQWCRLEAELDITDHTSSTIRRTGAMNVSLGVLVQIQELERLERC